MCMDHVFQVALEWEMMESINSLLRPLYNLVLPGFVNHVPSFGVSYGMLRYSYSITRKTNYDTSRASCAGML